MGADTKTEDKFDADGNKLIALPVVGYEMKERNYYLLCELFGVFMAIFSIITAVVAFNKIKASSTDVAGIVANWQMTPISDVLWVNSNQACPTGYAATTPMTFPQTTLGCACNGNAQFKWADGSLKPASSSATAFCLKNQTNNNLYTCSELPSLQKVILTSWTGQIMCVKRGGTSAMNSPAPDASDKCPTGTQNCGTGSLSLCQPSSMTTCPINWMSDTNALGTYALTANSPQLSNINSVGYSYSGQVTNPADSGTHYYEAGPMTKISAANNWTPLPIVELGSALGTPCYGEADALTGSQAQLQTPLNTGNKVNIPTTPACSQKQDPRFMTTRKYPLGNLIFENYVNSNGGNNACQGAAPGKSYDYFANPTTNACDSSISSGPNACLQKSTPSGAGFSCNNPTCCINSSSQTDQICLQAAFQSQCGVWQNLMSTNAGATASFYQKAQIYWSLTCPYTKDQVMQSNGPLQYSIKVQNALLILNVVFNVVVILMGLYIAMLCCKNDAQSKQSYETLEGTTKPRVSTVATLVKIPVVIATIVVTQKVVNFYVTLGTSQCAGTDNMGAITNDTFTFLAKQLPGVIQANIGTLAMDIIGFIPIILAYVKYFCCGKKQEALAEADSAGAKASSFQGNAL